MYPILLALVNTTEWAWLASWWDPLLKKTKQAGCYWWMPNCKTRFLYCKLFPDAHKQHGPGQNCELQHFGSSSAIWICQLCPSLIQDKMLVCVLRPKGGQLELSLPTPFLMNINTVPSGTPFVLYLKAASIILKIVWFFSVGYLGHAHLRDALSHW